MRNCPVKLNLVKARRWIFALACGLIFCAALSGCRTPQVWPPISLSEPGWKIFNGQAVWHPRPKAPELSGDVILALHTNGNAFVQFSKTLPFATARLDPNRWQIEFPSEGKKYSGRNPPVNYFVWPQLPWVLSNSNPPAPWKKTGDTHHWTLKNPRTGETLQGYFEP